MTIPSSVGSTSTDLADKAAESADAAIRSARQKAHDALDGISNTMQNVKDQASATFEKLRPQLDTVTTYAKEEPTKALLIAAAAGAGIMGLVALLARGYSRPQLPSEILRNAAYEAAGAARQIARDAARDAADRASSKADGLVKTARSTAQSALDGLTDTMQQWRDTASPMVDRVKPQIDNVMTYAKDDPGKALLIAAAAGAALMGLMNTLTR